MKALIEDCLDIVKVLLKHNAKVDIGHFRVRLHSIEEIKNLILSSDFDVNEFDADSSPESCS